MCGDLGRQGGDLCRAKAVTSSPAFFVRMLQIDSVGDRTIREAVVLSFVLATVVALLPKVTLAADMFSGTWKSSNCVYQLELINDVFHRVANCTNNPPVGNVHEEYIVRFDGKDSPMIAVQNGK